MFFPVQSEMGTAPMASGAKSYCLKVGVKVNLIFPLLSTTDEKKDKGKEIKHVSWTVESNKLGKAPLCLSYSMRVSSFSHFLTRFLCYTKLNSVQNLEHIS